MFFIRFFYTFSLIALLILFPEDVFGIENNLGQDIFIKNCAGCHINGGNIIRRNKTLKLKDLKRNGIDNQELIAEIAKNGIGIMSGYEEAIGRGGDELVAKWIWEQAQNAWTQG